MKDLLKNILFLVISLVINYVFVTCFEYGAIASYVFVGALLRMMLPDDQASKQRFWPAIIVYVANMLLFSGLCGHYLKINIAGQVLFITKFLLLSLAYWAGWLLIDWLDAPMKVDLVDKRYIGPP